MTDLSPAAQAILDAAFTPYDCDALYSLTEEQHAGIIVAAALRAVVLQCEYCDDYGTSFIDPKDIHAIATELEGQ